MPETNLIAVRTKIKYHKYHKLHIQIHKFKQSKQQADEKKGEV